MPTNNISDESSLTGTQKVVAALIGVLVVAFFVLLIIGTIRLAQRLTAPKSSTPVVTTKTPSGQNLSDTNGSTSYQTDYKTMPSTGPKENLMVGIVGLLAIGVGSIVISKRIF